ncbi:MULTISPECIES: hypothetical protein [Halomonas]|nr:MULTISPECIES: hypothetical protein [Halomonas]
MKQQEVIERIKAGEQQVNSLAQPVGNMSGVGNTRGCLAPGLIIF